MKKNSSMKFQLASGFGLPNADAKIKVKKYGHPK